MDRNRQSPEMDSPSTGIQIDRQGPEMDRNRQSPDRRTGSGQTDRGRGRDRDRSRDRDRDRVQTNRSFKTTIREYNPLIGFNSKTMKF